MSPNEEIVQSVIVGSPYGALLGLELARLTDEEVVVRLPYRPQIVTVGDVVHGGAIASLVDAAATAAVWAGTDLEHSRRGTTVGFTVSFLSAARGQDLLATARVIQRGRTLCVCEVRVDGASDTQVARGLVTYKVG